MCHVDFFWTTTQNQPLNLMSLSKEDVQRVSLLARLKLSDDELSTMTEQLGQIVNYIDKLSELDTEGVEPMAHALDLTNALVDDEPHESLPREMALQNAPRSDDECFRVPAVLGE